MIDALPLLLGPEGYQISRSVRLRSSASAYFSRTPASAGSRTTWTMSFWMKLGNATGSIFGGASASNNPRMQFYYNAVNGVLEWYQSDSGGGTVFYLIPSQVFRDHSAWYHIVVVADTTQATSSNRLKYYVNGVQVTAFNTATYPSQNTNTEWNTNTIHNIGRQPNGTSYWDGYLTEINFIDGQALTPSSFGETNAVTGVWQPKKYTGTYGTNGFYLNFSDNSSNTATTIGKDYSGNGNNWTPNNISVTSGATYDSMLDVPTQWADGGNGRGNYCVMNAVSAYSGLPLTAANIQTSAVPSGGNWYSRSATMGISSGKWYAEFSMPSITSGSQGNPAGFGIIPASNDFSAAGQLVGDTNRGYGFYCPDTAGSAPVKRVSSSNTSVGTGTATATTDVFMVAFDLTNGNAWFGKNGTWYAGDPAAGTGASITGIVANDYVFGVSVYRDNTFTNNTVAVNFGQRPFAYTPPSGFKALNTQNLPTPTILKGGSYFNTVLYTGNGGTLSVTGVGFQPDFVWLKSRGAARSHRLWDAVRGATNGLSSDLTNAEYTESGLTAFNSDGFTLGSQSGSNTNAESFVAWNWKEGATQGFDIVTYTGTGANRTVAHNLGVAPSMIIIKVRTSGTAQNWMVGHTSIGWGSRLEGLNTTSAAGASATTWNNTAPTSSVFSLGTEPNVNNNGWSFVAYLFSEVAGFSRFGSYTGNGSADGPFVFCGFRPRWVMFKKTNATSNWSILDTSRNTFNVANSSLLANLSDAERTATATADAFADILSNGFKLRGNSGDINDSGATYIFAAFAEHPFKNALAR